MKPKDRLDAKLRDHLDRLTRDFIAAGMDPREAARRARLEFGGIDQIAEECRDVRGCWLEDFAKDLRCTATLGGFFGVMAFQVSRRINEFGVRMALGASRSSIVRVVLREAAGLLAAGSAVGVAAALALTGLARKLLFGVTPTDPAMFAIAVLVLAAAVIAAAWIPARRASRVDPMAAVRHE